MKTIGIIGGMGPMATVDLMEKIIQETDAHEDQEHIPILVDNNTRIPDRTAAILGQGESPVPELLRSAKRLTEAGADFLIMGCNTAHYFLPAMLPHLTVPFLSIIDTAARFCQSQGFHKIGLLASAGTCKAGIYQKALQNAGISVLMPDREQESTIHSMIYEGVKAGKENYDTAAVECALASIKADGAEAFLLGCTEIPVAVRMYHIKGNFIDATDVLAKEAIRLAGAAIRA
ncbi:MAG: aspartate/glutamate racemase family protein [Mitsuokella sp.]